MEFKSQLRNIFKKYNIEFSEDQIALLHEFHTNMIKYNEIHNLTRIVSDEDAIIKHYLDCVLPVNIFKNNKKVIDIGCGGGFPSVPLKIMNKSLDFTAIDSVNKKTNFVILMKNHLNLANFNVIHTRIEDLAHNLEYREKYDYAISRAVAPLNTIIEYSAPFLKENGYIVSYKGSNYEEEIKNSEKALEKLNCKIEKVEKYYIEELDTYRFVIIIKKIGKTSKIYPRKQNKPRIQPL